MKYIASCSFGKDSLAMILKLLELHYPLDEVIYYNTGAEFKAIDNNKNKLIPILEKNNIVFTELKPKEDFFYTMLERKVKHNDGTITNGYMWCGGVTRWGTSNKVNAIKEHYKKYGDEFVIEYVGIAIDEQERILREREREVKKLQDIPVSRMGNDRKRLFELLL